MTGYGLVVFDNRAVFYRAYLFYLCQNMSFDTVCTMWRTAHECVPKFEDMSANVPKFGKEQYELVRQWFGIASTSPADCRSPPLSFQVLHAVPNMDAATHRYFSAGPRVDSFFFFGKVATWEIGFASSVYSTAAAGELPQEFFTNVGFAQLCGWYMMKKSWGSLPKFGLADVMAKFCPSMPKLADMPYNDMFGIIERGDDPWRLGDVARCAHTHTHAHTYTHSCSSTHNEPTRLQRVDFFHPHRSSCSPCDVAVLPSGAGTAGWMPCA